MRFSHRNGSCMCARWTIRPILMALLLRFLFLKLSFAVQARLNSCSSSSFRRKTTLATTTKSITGEWNALKLMQKAPPRSKLKSFLATYPRIHLGFFHYFRRPAGYTLDCQNIHQARKPPYEVTFGHGNTIAFRQRVHIPPQNLICSDSLMHSSRHTSTLLHANSRSPSSSSSSSRTENKQRLSSSRKYSSSMQSRTHKNSRLGSQHNATWLNDQFFDLEEEPIPSHLVQEFERNSPFPMMPSPLFINLAHSQFELLSNSLVHNRNEMDIGGDGTNDNIRPGTPKISSMALYLPKENEQTGQLEFVPAVTYPNPSSERVFIASDSQSGIPPTIPPTALTSMKRLPGFARAQDLIPSYPFVAHSHSAEEEKEFHNEQNTLMVESDNSVGSSAVEEISTGSLDESGPKALSVTLLSGLQTLGVLMIWPLVGRVQQSPQSLDDEDPHRDEHDQHGGKYDWAWTPSDKLQVTRAAKSLALALSMDTERTSSQIQSEQFRVALADNLHQVKSPLQALRTFGKLLQRQLAEEYVDGTRGGTNDGVGSNIGPTMERMTVNSASSKNSSWGRKQRQALKLAEDMMAQGERVVDLIEPMDNYVQSAGKYQLNGRYLLLPQQGSADSSESEALILRPLNEVGSKSRTDTDHFQLPPALLLDDFDIEMAFPQDVLGPIVYASQAVSLEQGINFDAVGFDPDAELPGVNVCSKSLQEAVSNLLDNAIKYVSLGKNGVRKKANGRRSHITTKNAVPQIKVTLTSNEPPLSPGATLYIEDNGPGIPKSEWDDVFRRGHRSKTVGDIVPGSGLGLSISKEIVLHMGGKLEILEDGPSHLGGTTIRLIVFRDVK